MTGDPASLCRHKKTHGYVPRSQSARDKTGKTSKAHRHEPYSRVSFTNKIKKGHADAALLPILAQVELQLPSPPLSPEHSVVPSLASVELEQLSSTSEASLNNALQLTLFPEGGLHTADIFGAEVPVTLGQFDFNSCGGNTFNNDFAQLLASMDLPSLPNPDYASETNSLGVSVDAFPESGVDSEWGLFQMPSPASTVFSEANSPGADVPVFDTSYLNSLPVVPASSQVPLFPDFSVNLSAYL